MSLRKKIGIGILTLFTIILLAIIFFIKLNPDIINTALQLGVANDVKLTSNELFKDGFYDQALEKDLSVLKMINETNDEATKIKGNFFVKIAKNYLKKAIKFCQANTMNSLGIIYQNLQDFTNADIYFDEAIALYKIIDGKREIAFAHSNFGFTALQRGEYIKALESYDSARVIFEKFYEDDPNTMNSLYLLGHNKFFIGITKVKLDKEGENINENVQQIKEAIISFEEHLPKRIEYDFVKFKYVGLIVHAAELQLEKNIFDDSFIQQKLDEAITIYEESDRQKHSILGKLYFYKARLLLKESGVHADVYPLVNKGWELLCENEDLTSLKNKYNKKKLGIKKTKDIFLALSNRAKIQFDISKKQNQKKLLEKSYHDILFAIELLEGMMNSYAYDSTVEVFLNNNAHYYQLASSIIYEYYMATGEKSLLDDLWYVGEKQKSYVLRKETNRKQLYGSLTFDQSKLLREGDSLLQNFKAIDYAYNAIRENGEVDSLLVYNNKNRTAQKKHQDWLTKLENTDPQLFDLLHSNKVISKKELIPNLKKDKAGLVEYIITENKIIALLITSKVDTVFAKNKTKATDELLEKFNQSLASNEEGDYFRNTAFDVYNFLFKDIDKILSKEKISRVYLVADEILHTISFNAMLTDENKEGWFNKLSYLLYKYEFSRQFSATNMMQIVHSDRQNLAMTFGGFVPDYTLYPKGENGHGYISNLEGDSTNVKLMGNYFNDKKIFTSATLKQFEDNFKDFSILHLSMHSFLNYENPNQSSLIFTFENAQESHEFDLGKLYNNTITADLVVLSACDTGGGKLRKGEGIISFNRAFLYAGSRSVVSSLWAANNDAAQIIIKYFYHNLAQRRMTKDKALTTALRNYVSEEPTHPSKWANFIIMGDLSQLSN